MAVIITENCYLFAMITHNLYLPQLAADGTNQSKQHVHSEEKMFAKYDTVGDANPSGT